MSAALCAPAQAADSLNVFTDSTQIALGTGTLLAAHAETDSSFGGGHIDFKYKPSSSDCQPTAAGDDGADANGGQPAPVAAGAGTADVGGQMVQLGVGAWRVCAWLSDDVTGTTVAVASTTVYVVPYIGALNLSVTKAAGGFQIVMTYSTSAPARLYAAVQKAGKPCSASAGKVPRSAVLLVPRGGRLVGSDGGLGRALKARALTPGRWRVCAWLKADVGAVGPVTKAFAVAPPRRLAGRVAG